MVQLRKGTYHEVSVAQAADIASSLISWAAVLCAGLGKTDLVITGQMPGDSKEPDEGNLHVRICGGSAG